MKKLTVHLQGDNYVDLTDYKLLEKTLMVEGEGVTRQLVRGMEYVEVKHWQENYLLKLEVLGHEVEVIELIRTNQRTKKLINKYYYADDYNTRILSGLFNKPYIEL